jgi:hypothetical protein
MTHLHHHQWFRKSYLVMMTGLIFGIGLLAWQCSQPAQAAFGIANPKHEQSMLWPLLPGESVTTLAAKLYPQSPVLQQRFVQQSISLSRGRGILFFVGRKADYAQLIAVPNAQALHTVTHRIKKADEADPQMFVTHQGLMMSLQMKPDESSKWHSWSLPTIHVPGWLKLNNSTSSAGKPGTSGIFAVMQDNLRSNTWAIVHTPTKSLIKQPHLMIILASVLLLKMLVVVWVWQKRRAITH